MEKISISNSIETGPESELYKRIRVQFGHIFDEFSEPEERIGAIKKVIEEFFRNFDKEILSEKKAEETINNLQACGDIPEKELFLDAVMKALGPVLKIRESHADKFEEAQARAMNESGGFVEINRLLSYEKIGSEIQLHAPAGRTVGNKLGLYREGMRKLAEIVEKDPEVEKITAMSHLVAKHPGLFTAVGFGVYEISDEIRQKHFIHEDREIKVAEIDREKFLKRFLK